MPNYEFSTSPAWTGSRHANNLAPVQLVSAANQLGKSRCSPRPCLLRLGTHFEEMQWIYEWQVGGGVNLMCENLNPCNMAGIRRGLPAFHFYQSPWWDDYKFLDYSSRIEC